MPSIQRLTLHNFRNYADQRFDIGTGNIALIGRNGAGKTNILEALSLFAPGRGLRSAALADMQKFGASTAWGIAVQLQSGLNIHDLSTGLDTSKEKEKRLYKIDGTVMRSQESFTDYLSLLWLTPQMDKLWLEDKSQRRRFLDKLISQFDPAHLGRITRYEQAMRERMKLLQTRHDAAWVLSLEKIMVESGTAIAAHRLDLIERLNSESALHNDKSFPRFRAEIDGAIEMSLNTESALVAEDQFFERLQQNRNGDALSGQTAIGTHRSDFLIYDAARNIPAGFCSTGEQKALLISLILAHAALIRNVRNMAPIMLLDEITTHLDEARREALLMRLTELQSQFWISSAESDPVIDRFCSVVPLTV